MPVLTSNNDFSNKEIVIYGQFSRPWKPIHENFNDKKVCYIFEQVDFSTINDEKSLKNVYGRLKHIRDVYDSFTHASKIALYLSPEEYVPFLDDLTKSYNIAGKLLFKDQWIKNVPLCGERDGGPFKEEYKVLVALEKLNEELDELEKELNDREKAREEERKIRDKENKERNEELKKLEEECKKLREQTKLTLQESEKVFKPLRSLNKSLTSSFEKQKEMENTKSSINVEDKKMEEAKKTTTALPVRKVFSFRISRIVSISLTKRVMFCVFLYFPKLFYTKCKNFIHLNKH